MIIRFKRNLRGERGEAVHAAAFMRKREIVLDAELLLCAPELVRIVIHEIFHFVWVRLDNGSRASWEKVVAAELGSNLAGELGYSAAWRKEKLLAKGKRAQLWRDYLCESFCDTAAWYFSPRARHDEVTLRASARRVRAAWFRSLLTERELPL